MGLDAFPRWTVMGQQNDAGRKPEAGLAGFKALYDWNRPAGELVRAIQASNAKSPPPPRPPVSPRAITVGVSLLDQIDCVRGEVSRREKSYPGQIAAGRLTRAEAAKRIGRMRAVLDTLVMLQSGGG
ncbi:MAG: hypothetical protein ACR2F8_01815 [Caulobacteraceae bacterium]